MNWVFSALGVFVFYFVAKRMSTPAMAELGTCLYASIYTAWFAGSIHSTYASELFFPLLLMLFILRYRDQHRTGDLVGACIAFALAAGFRPSDGTFLAPLFLFFVVRYVSPWRQRAAALGLVCLLCLAWFIPNQAALRESASKDIHPNSDWRKLEVHTDSNWTQLERMAPLLHWGSLALLGTNAIRLIFPLALAFWPLIPWLLRRQGNWEVRTLLWLWIFPGLSFFLAVFISDAMYFSYLLAAVVLCFCVGTVTRLKVAAVAVCMVFNIGFYLLARPMRASSAPIAIFDAYGAKFTLWGVRHQYTKTLRDLRT
jgi:hypothetical protein